MPVAKKAPTRAQLTEATRNAALAKTKARDAKAALKAAKNTFKLARKAAKAARKKAEALRAAIARAEEASRGSAKGSAPRPRRIPPPTGHLSGDAHAGTSRHQETGGSVLASKA